MSLPPIIPAQLPPAPVQLITLANYQAQLANGYPAQAGSVIIDPISDAIVGVVDGNGVAQPYAATVFYPRSTATLAGAPSAADIALGASAQFYDPMQSPLDSTHPWVYYSAVTGAYVKVSASATGAVTSVNGQTGAAVITSLGINAAPMPGTITFNATTGYVTDGTNSVQLASGTIPVLGGKQYFAALVTVAGNWSIDGISQWNVGDVAQLEQSGASQAWFRNAGNPTDTTKLVIPDGQGGLVSATPDINYKTAPLLNIGIPCGVAPSGTFTTNGSVTFNTAVTAQSTNSMYPGLFLWYPQGAINTTAAGPGYAAGYYYTVPQSTTTAIVYNNIYTPSSSSTLVVPAIPATPTAFTGVTGGVYTPTTATFIATHILPIAANYMGTQGDLEQLLTWRVSSSANNKQVQTKFGALNSTTNVGMGVVETTNINNSDRCTLSNMGFTNYQTSQTLSDVTHTTGVKNSGAIDTTQLQYLILGFNLSNATDWIVFEKYRVIGNPKA